MSNTNNTLTKEQLFACLEYDKVEVDVDTIEQARNNDEFALYEIGYEYKHKVKDYSKAMAWYRLAANQKDSSGDICIGVLYHNGEGVPQDYLIAMEYYLKAAGNSSESAIYYVGELFLKGSGVPVDKYKALEWFIKSGTRSEQIEKLNSEGIHLKEEDKDKTIYQLINEAEDALREVRKKNESELKQEIQELKGVKSLNENEITNLRRDNQKLQNETQQKKQQIAFCEQEKQNHLNKIDNLDQQLKREIESSKKVAQVFEMLVQSKNNEIDVLKQIQKYGNLESELRELKRKPGECQEPASLIDNNITTNSNNNNNNNDSPKEQNSQGLHGSATIVKTEESELPPCQNENKKRRLSSNDA